VSNCNLADEIDSLNLGTAIRHWTIFAANNPFSHSVVIAIGLQVTWISGVIINIADLIL
jgi:hypothetical protein